MFKVPNSTVSNCSLYKKLWSAYTSQNSDNDNTTDSTEKMIMSLGITQKSDNHEEQMVVYPTLFAKPNIDDSESPNINSLKL